jgi:hypothetical protein
MKLWWWISVPYSILFPVLAFLFDMSPHGLVPLFVLSWLTALSSAVWMLVTSIRRWTGLGVPWASDMVVRLALSLVASLWLLQPLGLLQWLALR